MRGECESSINEFLDSVERAFSRVDERAFWPVSGSELFPLYSEVQAMQVYKGFEELVERGVTLREIAQLFPTPSVMRQLLTSTLVVGLKVARKYKLMNFTRWGVEEFTCLFLQALREKQPRDPLLTTGKNHVWSEGEVREMIAELEWSREVRAVPKAVVALDSLVWALYFDLFVANGLEIAGPYDVSDTFGPDRTLLIREYHDLAPLELWPDLKPKWPGKLRIYLVYKGVQPEVDWLLHIRTSIPLGAALELYAVDPPLDINSLREATAEAAYRQTTNVAAMGKLEQLRKGVEISYYPLRNFFEASGESWRTAALKAIAGLEEHLHLVPPQPAKTTRSYRSLFDPRTETIE